MEEIPVWALLVVAGVTGFAWMQQRFVPASTCALQRERSNDTALTVHDLVVRQSKTETEVAKLATHIRWQTAALASLMHKAGANGVPPPPVE